MEQRNESESGGVCHRPTATTTRIRDLDIVYTDMFLDTFNYENDLLTLWNDLLGMNTARRGSHKALLVVSNQLYNTIGRNGNGAILFDGRCIATTAALIDEQITEYPLFEAIVFFNMDPFEYARRAGALCATTTTPAGVKRFPFLSTLDRHMTGLGAGRIPTVHIAFNTFFLATESVVEYEQCRGLRFNFRSRILPVHSYAQEVISHTVCNFFSDVLPYMRNHIETYVLHPGNPIPSPSTLGPAAVEQLFRPGRLVLLDVSDDHGGQSTAAEYFRFKQFYYSFAHGHDNKWGLSCTVTLYTYLQRWNVMLREELTRWYWVLQREAEMAQPESPVESPRQALMRVYAMCPCLLSALNINRDVCDAVGARPTQVASPATTLDTGGYLSEILTSKYDTSTFDVGAHLSDVEYEHSLLASEISLNDMFAVTNHWVEGFKIDHNRFFQTFDT